jgi:ABC-2 type transport system ATP-binding protein
MPPILHTEQLSKRYNNFYALDHCNLSVDHHCIFGLLGPNGAGKTTLIRCLLGYLKPSSGSASILGLDCHHQSLAVRQQVSYLPAEPKLFRLMRGADCIEFFTSIHPRGNAALALSHAKRLNLDLNRRVAFMSTGMRRKLSICCVLGCPSPLMILDEPTENLDPTVRNTVIELVRELHQQGSTIVFCSHILSEIESLCDHVGILRNGQVVRTAKLSDLQATHHLQADYPSPQSSTLPKNFPSNIPENVKVILRSETSVLLELRGPLEPLLPWICSCGLENIRIHNVGVQGLYQEFHAPTLRVQ